jgi:2-dehydro-3-deoxyglucarate aldolase
MIEKLYLKTIKLKNRLKKNNNIISIGSWLQIPDSNISEIMSHSNFEWLVVDLEHGSFSKNDMINCFRGISLGNSLPFARVRNDSKTEIQEALDSGACGIIIPNVKNQSQLQKIIANSCWPPKGNRGVGFSRSNIFGKFFEKYKIFAQNPFLVAMVECKEGLENIDMISKNKALDVVLIGPYDLSASLGSTGNFTSKKFTNAIKKIVSTCKNNKISVGIHQVAPIEGDLKKLIKKGFNFIPYGIDTSFLNFYCKVPKLKK